MQASEISYSEYQERHFPNLRLVLEFGDYQFLSSSDEGIFWLLAVRSPEQEVIVCEYPSAFERQREIESLRRAFAGNHVETVPHNNSGARPNPGEDASPPSAPTPPSVPSANVVPKCGL